jgi:hypothetical protein
MRNRLVSGLMACLFLIQSMPFSALASKGSTDSIENYAERPSLVTSNGNPSNPVLTETQVLENVDPSQIGEMARALAEKTGQQVIISTDNSTVIQDVIIDFDDQNIKNTKYQNIKKPKFLVYGDKFKAKAADFADKAETSIKENKIGLVITVVTTGLDTIYWLHAGDLSGSQLYMLIAYNWIINLKFGIDPDSWTDMTKSIDERITSAFKKFGMSNKKINSESMAMTRRYLSNMGLYFGVYATRYGIINLDHLGQSLQTTEFWAPLLIITAAASFTSFGWGEFLNRINKSTHPIAKETMRLFSYFRQTFMGFAAPSAALMNGSNPWPWAALMGHGVLGLLAFKHRPQIANLIEKSSFMKWADKAAREKRLQQIHRPQVLDFTRNALRDAAPRHLNQCTMVFN